MNNSCVLGFNGDRLDPISGTTHLGNGYRAYNPVLMRFNCPDNWSPFGDGGINPYAYCAGDPVNRADPTGHLSWPGIGMGIIGLGLAIFSGGASIAAAAGVMAAIESATTMSLTLGAASVVSDVTAIVSGAVEESNPKASVILGWVTLGTGAMGLVHVIYSVGCTGIRTLKSSNTFRITLGLSDEFRSPSILGISRERSQYPLELNAGMPENIAYRFRDTVSGQRRLNIVAHRIEVNYGQYRGRLQIGDGQYRADDIPGLLLNQHVDLNHYDVIRFISCDSALDIAGDFAHITGKNTIGYRGPVTIEGRTSDFAHASIDNISPPHGPFNMKGMNREFRQRYDAYARNMAAAERMNNNIAFYRVAGEEEGFFPQPL